MGGGVSQLGASDRVALLLRPHRAQAGILHRAINLPLPDGELPNAGAGK